MNDLDKIEKTFIRIMLDYPDVQKIYSKKLDVNDFRHNVCSRCLELMKEFRVDNLHFDLTAAIGKYKISEVLDYPDILTSNGLSNAETYFQILRQERIRKELKQASMDYVNKISDESVFEDLRELSENINQIRNTLYENRTKGKSEQINNYIKMLDSAYSNKGIQGLQIFGDNDVNKTINGAERGDVIVLAGRPGMGKTAHAVQIFGECLNQGIPARFYSLEMTDLQLLQRLESYCTPNGYTELRDGKVFDEKSHYEFLNAYESSGSEIIEKSMSWTELENDVLAHHNLSENGVRVVIIDYLQLIQGERNRNKDSETEILNRIAKGCKSLAKSINGTVIPLSQLNRDVEKRTNKQPQLSDLKQSGAIEENADKVLMYYRPSYYGLIPNNVYHSDYWDGVNLDRIINAKNRGGEPKDSFATFDFEHMRFIDLRKEKPVETISTVFQTKIEDENPFS